MDEGFRKEILSMLRKLLAERYLNLLKFGWWNSLPCELALQYFAV